jgi:hypothetical protein
LKSTSAPRGKGKPQNSGSAENQLQEMITRDHNRASVIIYSVANETPISDVRGLHVRRRLFREGWTVALQIKKRLAATVRSRMKDPHFLELTLVWGKEISRFIAIKQLALGC